MREKRREATIERIVEQAMHLLETEGFEALTIQRLAKELNYAVGALYRYFRSKDALLVALLGRVMDRVGEDMSAGLEWVDRERAEQTDDDGDPGARDGDQTLTPAEGLLRLIVVSNVYVSFAQSRSTEYGLVSTLIGDPREFLATEAAAPIFPALVRLQLMLISVIDDAVKAGALDQGSARERGVILWSAMQGVLQLRKLGRFGVAGVELDRLAPIALQTLLMGWGADPKLIAGLTPRALEIADTLAKQRAQRQAEHHAAREAKNNQGSETDKTDKTDNVGASAGAPQPASDPPAATQPREVEDDTTR